MSVNNSQNTRLTSLENTASTAVNGVRFRRVGKMVSATLDGSNRTVPSWGNITLCTIPTGYRPNADYSSSAVSYECPCSLRANADGKMYLIARGTVNNAAVDGEVVYFTNDA